MASSANDRQVGGTHYAMDYQHWDFVTDLKLPYLIGCATKYPTRWRGKNGLEDLRKAVHYIDKAEERGIFGIEPTEDHMRKLQRFVGQLPEHESEIIMDVVLGDYQGARDGLAALIASETDGDVAG